jgi:cobalt/nickel transport system ATP-binding protein
MHSLEVAREIADRCLVLAEGRLEASGSVDEILSNEALMQRTHLLHVHRHRHASGDVHSHPHLHS